MRIALALLVSCWLPGTPQAQAPHTIRAELDGIAAALRDADAVAAAQALADLLGAEGSRDAARVARYEIEELDRRIRFLRAWDEPDYASLVHGTIHSLSLKRNRIDIEYTDMPDALRDFERHDRSAESRDWRPLLVHPAVFDEFELTIEGEEFRNGTRVIFDHNSTEYLLLDTNAHASSIHRVVGEEWEELDATDPIPQPTRDRKKRRRRKPVKLLLNVGEPYELKCRVNRRRVHVLADGKTLVQARTPKRPPGKLAIRVDPKILKSIRIRGTFDPSWLQTLADTARLRAQGEFDRTHDPQQTLPAWLFEDVAGDDAAGRPMRPFPGDERPDADAVARIQQQLDRGDYKTALFTLVTMSERSMPPLTRAYYRASVQLARGEAEMALEFCDELVAGDPEFAQSYSLRGHVHAELGLVDDAAADFEKAIACDPGMAGAYAGLARLALRVRRLDAAQGALDRGRRAGVVGGGFEQVAAMVLKVRLGPRWPRTFVFESEHYRIASDIDERTCEHAAGVLEDALAHYASRIGKPPIADGQRYQVYVFSGVDGYDRYCANVLGAARAHTAGLYSPFLKQLLIWNQPDRTNTLKTIRHEGFHQYLDSVAPGAPPWLHEGTAEYFEVSSHARGKPKDGVVQPHHVLALQRFRHARRISIERLVRLDAERFYANSAMHYPLAWALVRYLRREARDGRKTIDRIVDGLHAGQSYHDVRRAVFATTDFKQLEKELWESVDRLAK